jgi:hypothetical protein
VSTAAAADEDGSRSDCGGGGEDVFDTILRSGELLRFLWEDPHKRAPLLTACAGRVERLLQRFLEARSHARLQAAPAGTAGPWLQPAAEPPARRGKPRLGLGLLSSSRPQNLSLAVVDPRDALRASGMTPAVLRNQLREAQEMQAAAGPYLPAGQPRGRVMLREFLAAMHDVWSDPEFFARQRGAGPRSCSTLRCCRARARRGFAPALCCVTFFHGV